MAVATPPGLTPCVSLTVDKSAESKAALELIHDMPRGCHVSDIHDLLPAETAAACRQTSSWQEMIDVVGRCDLRGRLGAGLVPANVPSRCLGWVGAESEHPPLIRPRIRASTLPGKLPLCFWFLATECSPVESTMCRQIRHIYIYKKAIGGRRDLVRRVPTDEGDAPLPCTQLCMISSPCVDFSAMNPSRYRSHMGTMGVHLGSP